MKVARETLVAPFLGLTSFTDGCVAVVVVASATTVPAVVVPESIRRPSIGSKMGGRSTGAESRRTRHFLKAPDRMTSSLMGCAERFATHAQWQHPNLWRCDGNQIDSRPEKRPERTENAAFTTHYDKITRAALPT
jgi:hypothetical protein